MRTISPGGRLSPAAGSLSARSSLALFSPSGDSARSEPPCVSSWRLLCPDGETISSETQNISDFVLQMSVFKYLFIKRLGEDNKLF